MKLPKVFPFFPFLKIIRGYSPPCPLACGATPALRSVFGTNNRIMTFHFPSEYNYDENQSVNEEWASKTHQSTSTSRFCFHFGFGCVFGVWMSEWVSFWQEAYYVTPQYKHEHCVLTSVWPKRLTGWVLENTLQQLMRKPAKCTISICFL